MGMGESQSRVPSILFSFSFSFNLNKRPEFHPRRQKYAKFKTLYIGETPEIMRADAECRISEKRTEKSQDELIDKNEKW